MRQSYRGQGVHCLVPTRSAKCPLLHSVGAVCSIHDMDELLTCSMCYSSHLPLSICILPFRGVFTACASTSHCTIPPPAKPSQCNALSIAPASRRHSSGYDPEHLAKFLEDTKCSCLHLWTGPLFPMELIYMMAFLPDWHISHCRSLLQIEV